MTNTSYQVNDTISYRPHGGGLRRVRVTAVEEINGRPGFDGVVLDGPEKGTSVWGYSSQIVSLANVVRSEDARVHFAFPAASLADEAGA